MNYSPAKKFLFVPVMLLLIGQGCVQIKSQPAGSDGGVFRSVDKGVSWQQKSALATTGQPRSFGGLNVTEIAFDPSDRKAIYAGTEDQGLFFSYDGAESWQHAATLGRVRVNAAAVSPADKCAIFVATGNKVMRSSDCSRTWDNVYFDPRPDARISEVMVDFFNPDSVYAGTSKGDLLKSADGGSSWSSIHRFNGEIRQLLTTSADSRVIYAVTRSKGLWKTTDGGTAWTDLSSGFGKFAGALDQLILAEDSSKPDSLVAASNYGLLKTTDGGATWTPIPLLTPPGSTVIYSLAVSPKDSNAVYYGTVNTFYRTTDGGAKWVTAKLPTTRAATTLAIDPANDSVIYMGTTLFQKKQGF